MESPFGDARITVQTRLAAEIEPIYDAVLLTCKAYDLDDAITTIAPGLAPGAYVLPLLNGIAHIDRLNARFGATHVLGGTAKIQATLTDAGTVKQFNDWRTITYGEQSGVLSARVEALTAVFAGAKGIEAIPVTDIMQRMWEKFVHLATAAAMTCLMRANVGEIVRTPEGGAIFLRQLQASADVAAANGHKPSEAFMQAYRETFSQRDSLYATSMLRDLERKGRTEVDHVIGAGGRDRTPGAAAGLHPYQGRRATPGRRAGSIKASPAGEGS
jgi:2-dehydropantoate 2-reductase